jgi:hypothetical protein
MDASRRNKKYARRWMQAEGIKSMQEDGRKHAEGIKSMQEDGCKQKE